MTLRKPARLRWLIAAGMAYALVVAAVAFWPTPVDRPVDGALATTLGWLHRHGLAPEFGYTQLEFLANVAFFVPLGLIAGLWLGPRRWWLAVACGAAASAVIETVQLLFLAERVASWSDIAANTIGAAAGVVAALLLIRYRRSSSLETSA